VPFTRLQTPIRDTTGNSFAVVLSPLQTLTPSGDTPSRPSAASARKHGRLVGRVASSGARAGSLQPRQPEARGLARRSREAAKAGN